MTPCLGNTEFLPACRLLVVGDRRKKKQTKQKKTKTAIRSQNFCYLSSNAFLPFIVCCLVCCLLLFNNLTLIEGEKYINLKFFLQHFLKPKIAILLSQEDNPHI